MSENSREQNGVANGNVDGRESTSRGILYRVEDTPPFHLCIAFAVQQLILCLGSTLSIPFILTKLLCADGNQEVTAQLLCISMFMCGVATLLQTTTGVRLGIIQGGSHTFIGPIAAMMALDIWKCPTVTTGQGNSTQGPLNVTSASTTEENIDDAWKIRMREIQGNLMLASLVQLVLGCTGMVGFFLRFIGPLTIAPTIALIGLSLTDVAAGFNEVQWGVSIFTIFLVLLFSTYLRNVKLPLPIYNKERKCHFAWLPLFQLTPVLLSVIIACILCYVLTVTDAIPFDKNNKHFHTRTDSKQDIISSMPWFYFPLPFNFGTPTVSVAGFVGMLGATLSAVIESTGDYFLCARISNAKPPPPHAVNRGHATEGFASFISGLVGAGHGTISYSGNIGEIGITKIASRVVFQTAGAIMIICGLIGKFGAVLSTIPDPIIGGTLTVLFGMVTAAGISTLRFVDMTSSRNAAVLATSLIMGLMIPSWVSKPENRIDTGIDELDQVLQVLMGTAILIGGIIAFILDNILPGTQEERGILKWLGNTEEDDAEDRVEVNYDIPLVTRLLDRVKCCSYFPISPTFHKEIVCPCSTNRVDENEFTDIQHTDIQMSEKL